MQVQAASCAQEEGEFARLVLADALFGGMCLKRWTNDVLKVPGALILDAKCVFDVLISPGPRRSAWPTSGPPWKIKS